LLDYSATNLSAISLFSTNSSMTTDGICYPIEKINSFFTFYMIFFIENQVEKTKFYLTKIFFITKHERHLSSYVH